MFGIDMLKSEIENFFSTKIKDWVFVQKLKSTLEETFNSDILCDYVEQQDNNTYIYDFINLLHGEIFEMIMEMLTETNEKRYLMIKKNIYELAYSVTDYSKIQIQNIQVLLNQAIYSIEYCWENSLDFNSKFVINRGKTKIQIPVTDSIADSKKNDIKYFQMNFNKILFLETNSETKLSDVFIFPVIDMPIKSMDSYDYIDKLIKHKVSNQILFLVGLAGTGKSSLLYKFSTIYEEDYIFYLSLKNLIDNEKREIDFIQSIYGYFGFDNHVLNKTLILDGLDEISDFLNQYKFCKDLENLYDKGFTIIFTTRPSYIFEDLYNKEKYPFILFAEIDFFNRGEILEWMRLYRQCNPNYKEDTIQSIKNVLAQNPNLNVIVSIPIMLYIISSQNIIIKPETNYTELYEMVFVNLIRDKNCIMKDKYINIHYNIAKEIAFIMFKNNWMRISESDIKGNVSILVDRTFYSSVYMNRIIEGEEYSEFVHKSIQDFFASKWIWENIFIDYKSYLTIHLALAQKIFSNEIIDNLSYIYMSCTLKNDVNNNINNLLKNLIDREFVFSNIMNYKEYFRSFYISCINIGIIYKKILKCSFDSTNHDLKKWLETVSLYLYYCKLTNQYDKNKVADLLSLFNGLNFVNINFIFNNNVYTFKENTMYNCNFYNCVSQVLDFQNTKIHNCILDNSIISNLNFINSKVDLLKIYNSYIQNINIISSVLKDINIEIMTTDIVFFLKEIQAKKINMIINNISEIRVDRSTFCDVTICCRVENGDFHNVLFSEVKFNNMYIKDCKFRKVRFYNCELKSIKVEKNETRDIIFEECTMSQSLLELLKKNYEVKIINCRIVKI